MTVAAETSAFEKTAQRRAADQFGMFVFLASEVMLFGGLFAAMSLDRIRHPGAAAQAAQHLSLWLGTANTAVLLTSSLLVALGSVSARRGHHRGVAACLLIAAALGVAFIGIKASEYHEEYVKGLMPLFGPPSPLQGKPANLFIVLYFVSTLLHALHVTIGVGLLTWCGTGVGRRTLSLPRHATTVDLVGLYWHLVDVIWLFLFPMLYLARP